MSGPRAHPHAHPHGSADPRQYAVQEYAAGPSRSEPTPRELLGHAELARLFDTEGSGTIDFVGDRYRAVLAELVTIIDHQWRTGRSRGRVKGFLLSGPPGTGKTTMAKRLAYEFARDGSTASGDVVLVLVDGSEIARSRYGESEERIRGIFAGAQTGFGRPDRRTVLLFDDVESVLMARDSEHSKEWHFAQDSVFFHAVDELDTSRCVVVLTTNRPDLVDDAIRDRFLNYTFDYPSDDVLVETALHAARQEGLAGPEAAGLADAVRAAASAGDIRSLRDVERFVLRRYVEGILGRPALAELSDPVSKREQH